MKRRTITALLLMLFNLPWICLWWRFTAPGVARGLSVPALYLLLVICTVGMVILPLALGGTRGKRWLLIVLLGIINLFWCLRWIGVFASTSPYDTDYAAIRHVILQLMVISSLAVIILYLLADYLLRAAMRDRDRPTPPASETNA